jgi:hypothetical protein
MAAKRGLKMININTYLSQKERTVLINCIKAIAPIFEMDCTNDNANDCLINAILTIEQYPEINILKRKVLKKHTPGFYVIQVQKKLSSCMEGETNENQLNEINEALHNALNCLLTF